MSRWAANATWEGDDLRREVFFFESGGVELYGSLYVAARRTSPYGVLCCNSWGVEGDRTDPLVRATALAMARLGGAGMVFHYPGYGDSYGEMAGADMEQLAGAAADAAAAAVQRCGETRWIMAGFMLGASVACLAQSQIDSRTLLLVQPALRPGGYFRWLDETSMQIAPGPSPREMMEVGVERGMAYGYPIPRRVLKAGQRADEAVASALAAFDGEGVVIRHARPAGDDGAPQRFPRIEVEGTWRFGMQNHPRLAKAAAKWLQRSAREVRA